MCGGGIGGSRWPRQPWASLGLESMTQHNSLIPAKVTRLISPTTSYQLLLPHDIERQQDGRVSSFWLDGKSLLLQISSYVRAEGEQISARQRLLEQLAKTAATSTDIHSKVNAHAPDQAAAEVVDANGVPWFHVYLVWPHLAIYASITGPLDEVRSQESWARSALESLALRVQ